MRQVLLSSLVLTAFFAVTGCSVSTPQVSRTPARAVSVDTSDPSWNPPDEVQFSATEPKTWRATFVASELPTPKRSDIPRGSVHAVY